MEHSTALVPISPPATFPLTADAARAQEYFQAAQAANTRRAYASDWKHFAAWCRAAGQGSLPAAPETVVWYLSALAETAKVSTLTRRLSAISQAHQAAGLETPTAHIAVRKLMAGIRRQKGTAQTGKKPLVTADLRVLLAPLGPRRVLDVRDRALLLAGFAGAFRRSELVGLDVGDLELGRDGLVVNIRRSKTDQAGQGRKVGIPYGSTPATCPVRALEAWLAVLGADGGPLFRGINRHGHLAGGRLTAQSVALIIKRLAAQAGTEARDLAGHSLRAGLATAAAAAGVSERSIMAQTGHRSLATLRKYIREGSLFLENAAAKVGL
jgi:site-specific recombinase XerD